MLHRVVEWLGELGCAETAVFPSGYMQNAQPDPLPGVTVPPTQAPQTPVAPAPAPVATKSSRWWVAPLLIGGTVGLIFWRTLALRGGSS